MVAKTTLSVALVVVVGAQSTFGFVNVPQVRKPALQSTSTSVIWEPTDVLTDAFNRNPFALEEELSTANPTTTTSFPEGSMAADPTSLSTAADPPQQHWFSQVFPEAQEQARQHTNWWIKYIQSGRTRRRVQDQMKVTAHNVMRDSGVLRSIVDFLVTIGTPSLALENPEIVPRFLKLTMDCKPIRYGAETMQSIDMFMPPDNSKPRGLVFFVVSSQT